MATNAMRELNRLLQDTGLLPQMPAFRYLKHGSIAFCWNSKPLSPTLETKYRKWAAWKFRVNRKKGTWKRVGQPIYYRRRKSAKAKAKQWYDKSVAQGIRKRWKQGA